MNTPNITTLARTCVVALSALFAASIAQAQLTISNAGFESPEVTATNGATGSVSDWTETGEPDGTAQILESGSGTAFAGSFTNASPPEGDQVLRLIEAGTDGVNLIAEQDLGTLTQSDIDNGFLDFFIGRDANEEIPVTSIGMIFTDTGVGSSYGSAGGFINGLAAPASDSFENRTIAISDFIQEASPANVVAGDSVLLRLVAREGDFAGLGSASANDGISGSAGTTDRNNVYFDNLQIVPEPSVYALLGGLLALGAVLLRRGRS